MCEPYPGPRCSFDMAQKVSQRQSRLVETIDRFGKDSIETSIAVAKLEKSQSDFNSTPEGIKTLTEKLKEAPEDKEIKEALWRGETTRKLQTIALKEEQMNRNSNLSKVFSGLKNFYDEDEFKSLINSVRDSKEQELILQEEKQLDKKAFESAPEEYSNFLDELEDHLDMNNNLNSDLGSALTELRQMSAPNRFTLRIYQQSLASFPLSRRQLFNEIRTISALHGVSPKIAAEYYEAYRKQYKDVFAHKTEADRPDPPTSWIRGDFNHSGYANDPNSRFAPHDPSSLYGIYRLRNDDKAIPDHYKQSRSYASILVRTNEDLGMDSVAVKVYTPNGRATKELQLNTNNETSKNDMAEFSNMIDGKILLIPNLVSSKWIEKNFTQENAIRTIIDPTDIARKHLDLPNYHLSTICGSAGIDQPSKTDVLSTASAIADSFFQIKRLAKRQWQQKPSRKLATPLESPPISRWSL